MKTLEYNAQKGRVMLRTAYDPSFVSFVKAIPSRLFDRKEKAWSISPYHAYMYEDQLLRFGFTADGDVADLIREYRARMEGDGGVVSGTFHPLPLFPYQVEGAAFLYQRKSAMLADQVGLGKTIQALAAVKDAGRVLVLCPSVLKFQWESEIKKFLPDANVVVVDGTKKQREQTWNDEMRFGVTDFVIANYELTLRDDIRHMERYAPAAVICDEATRISNPKAKTTKAVKSIGTKRRIALTGTPVSNRAQEIWSIMDWIEPGLLGTYWNFVNRYTVKDHWGSVVDYQNLDELAEIIRPFYLRRLTRDVMKDLPDKISVEVPFKMNDKERKLYKQIQQELLFEFEQSQISKVENVTTIQQITVKMTRLQQLVDSMELLGEDTTSSKLEVLQEIVSEMTDNERKVIVFTRFAQMAKILERELGVYEPLRISGDVPNDKRDEVINAFNSESRFQVLVMTDAGAMGLNIQAASVVVHYDMPWSVAKLIQREGRAHRIGQEKTVLSYALLAKGTVDMHVARTLRRKQGVSDAILSEELSTTVIDREDVHTILTDDGQ